VGQPSNFADVLRTVLNPGHLQWQYAPLASPERLLASKLRAVRNGVGTAAAKMKTTWWINEEADRTAAMKALQYMALRRSHRSLPHSGEAPEELECHFRL
jgi:hypothetical protein